MNLFKRRPPALVLKNFQVSTEDGTLLVVGRRAGIIAWVLATVGLDVTTTLACTPTSVRFRASSLFGEEEISLAASAVASTSSGYAKPIGDLIAAVVFVIAGLYALSTMVMLGSVTGGLVVGGLCVLLAVYCLVRYALNKRIQLSVETAGGRLFGLAFKRSIIEGVAVDIDRARAAMALLNRNVLEAQNR